MTGPAFNRIADYYGDGTWYDAEYVHVGGDIPYYVQVAADTNGAILELACGTGRLTIPMAEAGASVHGIDNAPAMVARAEEKRIALPPGDQERLSFEVADMRTARLGRKFSAVVLGFNTLMHMLEDDDLEAALITARAHLTPQGLFHLDLHTPFPDLRSQRDPDGRYDPQEMIEPRTRQRYIVTENNVYDPRNQINRMQFFYQPVDLVGKPSGPERRAEVRLRVLFPRELDTWLHRTGFEVLGDWEDFERHQPFSGRGGRRVLMLRPR